MPRTYVGAALDAIASGKTCNDCGTRGNVCRDSDGINRCHSCFYAKWWHKLMYAPGVPR